MFDTIRKRFEFRAIFYLVENILAPERFRIGGMVYRIVARHVAHEHSDDRDFELGIQNQWDVQNLQFEE